MIIKIFKRILSAILIIITYLIVFFLIIAMLLSYIFIGNTRKLDNMIKKIDIFLINILNKIDTM